MKRKIEILGILILLAYFAVASIRDPAPAPLPTPARDSSGRPPKGPLDPADRLPPGPIPSEEDVAYVRQALAKIYAPVNQRRGLCGNIYFGAGRFFLDVAFHRRECRLIAQAYPAAAEKVAAELHQARASALPETRAALPLLAELARLGNRRSELILLQAGVSTSLHGSVVDEALDGLASVDRDLLYEPVLLERCRRGWSRVAYFYLDVRPSPAAEALFRKIVSDSSPKDYDREQLEPVLRRYEMLRRPDADSMIAEILLREPTQEADQRAAEEDRRWALRSAQFRKLDLRTILRRRLDRNLDRAMETYPAPRNPAFEEYFRTWPHFQPRDWDECLLAYLECGGVPNDLERKRLVEFGYRCDPKARLAEILAALK